MRSTILTLFLLAFPAIAIGQPASKITSALRTAMTDAPEDAAVATWIFFADKGPDTERRLAEVEASLTPHARARRLRNRPPENLVDWYDIPVDGRYVDHIRRDVRRLRHRSRWLNAVSVDATPAQLERLTRAAFVRRLDIVHESRSPLPVPEPQQNRIPAPDEAPHNTFLLDYGSSLTQNSLINDMPLHDLGYSGAGVVICMLDTGFNHFAHEAFEILDIGGMWDFVNNDPNVTDQVGQMGTGNHGTFTLGAIAGFEPGYLIGPAWGATYLLAKTENTEWERHIEEDHWVAGAEWADSLGADIISSSLGYLDGFTNGEANYSWQDMDGNTTIVTIGADIAASRGILVVNSAGNEGSAVFPENTIVGPCDGDSVLCVGAVTSAGNRALFSSMGPTEDGRTKPDVMAMGVSVLTASPVDPSGYNAVSGTSLACPLIAGAAALMLDANPSLSVMDIIDALRSTADNAASPDNEFGWGIVDVTAALQSTITGTTGPVPSPMRLYPAAPNPFNPSTTLRYELPRPSYAELRVYDIAGRPVATLVAEERPEGINHALWDGTDDDGAPVPSGVYLYELRAGGMRLSRKVVLLK
jgi:serine protease AprX